MLPFFIKNKLESFVFIEMGECSSAMSKKHFQMAMLEWSMFCDGVPDHKGRAAGVCHIPQEAHQPAGCW